MKKKSRKDSSSLWRSSDYSEESFFFTNALCHIQCPSAQPLKPIPTEVTEWWCSKMTNNLVIFLKGSWIYYLAKNEGCSLANTTPLMINRENSCTVSHHDFCLSSLRLPGMRPGSSGKHRHSSLKASQVNPLTVTSGTWVWYSPSASCKPIAQTFAESGHS